MDHHHGIVVHVDDSGAGGGRLGEFVDVGGGGKPGADVEVLVDSGVRGQVGDGPVHEASVFLGGGADVWEGFGDLVGGFAVGGDVVFAAEPVVVAAGRVRPGGVDRLVTAAGHGCGG
ncbi:hypothetical protein Phou_016780 [Phytohabitans houttuyneae]|uniref:Uncharacterized protein n=1 Tax=Phytohabitans houttuyneae TaxID=1076126 RepID=A0A6V8K5C1_9ACTN|nr:hypothetical protein Phou_016780 [Phytohabitans houttuyneae]